MSRRPRSSDSQPRFEVVEPAGDGRPLRLVEDGGDLCARGADPLQERRLLQRAVVKVEAQPDETTLDAGDERALPCRLPSNSVSRSNTGESAAAAR